MNILIIEDETIIAAELSLLLQNMGYNVCGIATNYSNGIKLLQEKSPDLAIIDINLGGSKTGVDVGQYINDNNNIPFIFLTSNIDKETINNALKTNPHAYLLKPFNETEIYSSIFLSLQNKSTNKKLSVSEENSNLIINNAVFIKDKGFFIKVELSDIIYFKSDKNYIEVITDNKVYIIRSTLTNLLSELPDNMFFKVHKSYAINIKKVSAINHEIIIVSGKEVPLSEGFRKEIINSIKTFS